MHLTNEPERKKAAYMKRHLEGKTDEAKADLARLALVRKQREEAKLKREQAATEKGSVKAESLNAGKSAIKKRLG